MNYKIETKYIASK